MKNFNFKKPFNDVFQEFDYNYCRNYIIKHQNCEYQKRKQIADDVLNNTFVFKDNWDMEPCYTPVHLEEMIWDYIPFDDQEWVFMLNRHSFLNHLFLAGFMEQDSKYFDKIIFFIKDWISKNMPMISDSINSRSLDTGIRCITWYRIINHLDQLGYLKEDDKTEILIAVKNQLDYLYDDYIEKYSLSNWGTPQTVAILLWHHTYGCKTVSDQLVTFARKEIINQVELQILEDGTQYEQSVMYHVEVYKNLLELCLFVPSYNLLLNEKLLKMADYIYSVTGSDGYQIALGDSDVTETRDILTTSAIFFDSKKFKNKAFSKVDIDSILLFGKRGIEKFTQIIPVNTEAFTNMYCNSGHVCHEDKNRYLFFKCGPFGSSHSHSDQNSFVLYDKGQPIIIDPGRYTYTENKIRYFLKSQRSHSTCFISDVKEKHIKDSWSYVDYPEAHMFPVCQSEEFLLLEGQVFDTNSQHTRQILLLPDGNTLLFDFMMCQGENTLQIQFILDDKVTLKEGKLNQLKVISRQKLLSESTTISKRYNSIEESTKLVKRIAFKDSISDSTLFIKSSCQVIEHDVIQSGSGLKIEESFGYEISGNGNHYLVTILGKQLIHGNKLYDCNGIKFKGRVVVYDYKKKRYHRLKN